ncbi:MAG: hypothetical protein GY938_29495 [Ketobacter sp.]|nr:hypothetical protein [Ketobacter sp.]
MKLEIPPPVLTVDNHYTYILKTFVRNERTEHIGTRVKRYALQRQKGKFFEIWEADALPGLLLLLEMFEDKVRKIDAEGRELIDLRHISKKKHLWNYRFVMEGAISVYGRKTPEETAAYLAIKKERSDRRRAKRVAKRKAAK